VKESSKFFGTVLCGSSLSLLNLPIETLSISSTIEHEQEKHSFQALKKEQERQLLISGISFHLHLKQRIAMIAELSNRCVKIVLSFKLKQRAIYFTKYHQKMSNSLFGLWSFTSEISNHCLHCGV
jgi:hypothetical protein